MRNFGQRQLKKKMMIETAPEVYGAINSFFIQFFISKKATAEIGMKSKKCQNYMLQILLIKIYDAISIDFDMFAWIINFLK